MVSKKFLARPTPTPAVQWTGDNASEIEEYGSPYGWTVVDNGTTASVYTGDPPVIQFTMAMNEWTGLTGSGHCSDAYAKEHFQEVADEDPVAYVTKKDPNV